MLFGKENGIIFIVRVIKIATAICILFLALTSEAVAFDFRFFFTGSGSDTLIEKPTTAYLFFLSDSVLADSYTDIIANGGIDTLDAYTSGIVNKWSTAPFIDFVDDSSRYIPSQLYWAVIQDDKYQTGWASDYTKSRIESANPTGYEIDPETGIAHGFMMYWTDDDISLKPLAAIPEPTSGLLLLIGSVLIALKRPC